MPNAVPALVLCKRKAPACRCLTSLGEGGQAEGLGTQGSQTNAYPFHKLAAGRLTNSTIKCDKVKALGRRSEGRRGGHTKQPGVRLGNSRPQALRLRVAALEHYVWLAAARTHAIASGAAAIKKIGMPDVPRNNSSPLAPAGRILAKIENVGSSHRMRRQSFKSGGRKHSGGIRVFHTRRDSSSDSSSKKASATLHGPVTDSDASKF